MTTVASRGQDRTGQGSKHGGWLATVTPSTRVPLVKTPLNNRGRGDASSTTASKVTCLVAGSGLMPQQNIQHITQPPSQTDEAQGAIPISWVKSGWGSRDWLVVLCFGSVVAPMPTSLARPVSLAPTHSIAHHGRLSSLECHSSHPAGFLPGLDHFSHFTPPHTSADCHLPAAADLTCLFTPADLRRQSEYFYCIVFVCAI